MFHFQDERRRTRRSKQKTIEQHKKKPNGEKSIKLSQILHDFNLSKQLPGFRDVKVYSEVSDVLSLYIPPALTDMNQPLVDRFIDYFMKQVKYTQPLIEFFRTIAYKLRHPDQLIQKFFILHGQGHDGKSFLTGAVKEIFNKYGRIVNERDMTREQFNGWQENMLFIWMEEVQNIANKHKLEELIKTMTTRNTSRRGMYKEVTEGYNNAIAGFNTNDDSLSGLCRPDNAVYERLVIIEFNTPTAESKKEVNEISRLTELLKNHNSEAAKSFIFTLYNYFLKQYELPDDFDIVRYNGSEKAEIIKQKQIANSSFVENWIIEENEKLVKKGQVRGVDTAYIQIAAAREYYKKWRELIENKNARIKWDDELESLGWKRVQSRISGHKEWVLQMDWKTWKQWLHERSGEVVEIDYFPDDYEDVE